MKRRTSRIVIAVLILGVLGLGISPLSGRAQQERTRRDFMRQKLEYSKGILEGLTTEDYALISKNAKALRLLSSEPAWNSKTTKRDSGLYLEWTTEFQKLIDDLGQKSTDRNLGGATVRYLRLTRYCVNCHQYVRDRAAWWKRSRENG